MVFTDSNSDNCMVEIGRKSKLKKEKNNTV